MSYYNISQPMCFYPHAAVSSGSYSTPTMQYPPYSCQEQPYLGSNSTFAPQPNYYVADPMQVQMHFYNQLQYAPKYQSQDEALSAAAPSFYYTSPFASPAMQQVPSMHPEPLPQSPSLGAMPVSSQSTCTNASPGCQAPTPLAQSEKAGPSGLSLPDAVPSLKARLDPTFHIVPAACNTQASRADLSLSLSPPACMPTTLKHRFSSSEEALPVAAAYESRMPPDCDACFSPTDKCEAGTTERTSSAPDRRHKNKKQKLDIYDK